MAARIKIVSFRKRPCDVDNVCGKYLVDSLVTAGVLPDDCPEHVSEVTHQQMYAADEEFTLVVIKFDKEK